MTTELKDIENEDDIKLMVDTFYGKVKNDTLIAHYFTEMAGVNWEKHLPVMYSFWSSILLGSMSYHGLPFPKHQRLPLTQEDFNQWLTLFFETVDELFQGPMATDAKARASQIAKTFQYKMNILK